VKTQNSLESKKNIKASKQLQLAQIESHKPRTKLCSETLQTHVESAPNQHQIKQKTMLKPRKKALKQREQTPNHNQNSKISPENKKSTSNNTGEGTHHPPLSLHPYPRGKKTS
jgi:hypothetical protein